MLTLFTTLARGTVAEVEEAIFEANAIRILEQQLRDAAVALEHSRCELACAMAHQASEERAVAALSQRIAELEASGRKAIAGGRDDLARRRRHRDRRHRGRAQRPPSRPPARSN